uniref:Alcohol dehydrogenase-like N-terminal domain-containing protein n=1 Tax=Bionectria ochroleuca TaxID=29856 RepID=A0A8H7N3M5_BIOOC
MRSLATKQYSKSDGFEILDLPQPEVKNPDDVLIKVKAASINPIDLHVANGLGKGYIPGSLPFKIGYDVCGTVVATGSEVSSNIKQGDEVWARVPEQYRGTVSEYVVSPAYATAHTPSSLSHLESASMPLVSLTALQVLDKANDIIEGASRAKLSTSPQGCLE